MKFFGLISMTLLLVTTAWAESESKDMGLDDIMDAYLLAKADVSQVELKPQNVEKEPYTVQVAAYLSEQDSIRHVQELKKTQKDVFYYTSFARGQVWYKVCVGRFDDIRKAEKFRKSFVKKMEEPFSVVIALKGKAADRQVASANEMEIKKAQTTVPVSAKMKKKSGMQVAMLKKDQAKNTDTVSSTITTATVKDYLYALQVGSFATEQEAKKKADSLNTGESAYVTSAVVNGKTWYRVLLGKFETKREAEVFRASYKQLTRESSAFVKRMSK